MDSRDRVRQAFSISTRHTKSKKRTRREESRFPHLSLDVSDEATVSSYLSEAAPAEEDDVLFDFFPAATPRHSSSSFKNEECFELNERPRKRRFCRSDSE